MGADMVEQASDTRETQIPDANWLASLDGQSVVTGFSPPATWLLGIKLGMPDLTANQHTNATAEYWSYVGIGRNFHPRNLRT